MTRPLLKYPRTQHLAGSRAQPGDEGLSVISFDELAGRRVVVEEKLDGSNVGLSFDADGQPRLQSRGHYLTGGPRERSFAPLKRWVHVHQDRLRDRLGTRYRLYGEWLYAHHTIYYDALPHYLLEFDVLDEERGEFLDTPARRALLADLPLSSAPLLAEGVLEDPARLLDLLGNSRFRTPAWRDALRTAAEGRDVAAARALALADPSLEMEGLYVKVEEEGRVIRRAKWVRAGFRQTVHDAAEHWLERSLVPNTLAPGVDLYRVGPA